MVLSQVTSGTISFPPSVVEELPEVASAPGWAQGADASGCTLSRARLKANTHWEWAQVSSGLPTPATEGLETSLHSAVVSRCADTGGGLPWASLPASAGENLGVSFPDGFLEHSTPAMPRSDPCHVNNDIKSVNEHSRVQRTNLHVCLMAVSTRLGNSVVFSPKREGLGCGWQQSLGE